MEKTIIARVKEALEDQEKSILDLELCKHYYTGAKKACAAVKNAYDSAFAQMAARADSLRYHKLAASLIEHDMSDVNTYCANIDGKKKEIEQAIPRNLDEKQFTYDPDEVDLDEDSDTLEKLCYLARAIGYEKTTKELSDLYAAKIRESMDRADKSVYRQMGYATIGMDRPYIYLPAYSQETTGYFGWDKTKIGKEVEVKMKEEKEKEAFITGNVVDRHVWYDGDISILDEYQYRRPEDAVECTFSDLSEQSKEVVKKLISKQAKALKNTNNIGTFSDLILDDGRKIHAMIDFSCRGVKVADKFENSQVWQNERRGHFTNLPDVIIETVVNDILDAKDGKTKFDQLNFSEYLSDAELKDLFAKDAEEKENSVEKAQEKPEKKKQKYHGR